MRRSSSWTLVIPLLLASFLVMGCDLATYLGFEKEAALAEIEDLKQEDEQKAEESKVAEANEGDAEVSRVAGNYRLTFTGEIPGPLGSFGPVNRTPALLTETSFTAKETQTFMSGADPKSAVQAKDTWMIDAVRTGNELKGSAKFERWRDDVPPLTVTWDGEITGAVADDGTIAGTLKGTFSNSEGFSKPFEWKFTGVQAK